MKKILLLLAVTLMWLPTMAQHVTEAEAQSRALQFLNQSFTQRQGVRRAPRHASQMRTALATTEYYVFSDEANGGFVVVSGEEAAPTILAYSDEGRFDAAQVPEAMEEWLEECAQKIRFMASHPERSTVSAGATIGPRIEPMVSSKWSQSSPFNQMCPSLNGQKAMAGCVPVAMAQIMYYHRYPETVKKTLNKPYQGAFNTWQWEVETVKSGTVINWSRMLDNYSVGSPTEAQKKAVAELVLYCGMGASATYGINATAANDRMAMGALKDYFGYGGQLTVHDRKNFTYQEWQEMLYNELSHGRPVYLAAGGTKGGHAFVCDGYDDEDFFHINWGWGGEYNAYLRLDILNYKSTDELWYHDMREAFNGGQGAVIGIHPQTSDDMRMPSVATRLFATSDTTYTRSAETANFPQVTMQMKCSWTGTQENPSIAHAVGVFQGETMLQLAGTVTNVTLGEDKSFKLTFGAGMAEGEYTLRPVWRNVGETQWKLTETKQFVRATVTSTTLTLQTGTSTSGAKLVIENMTEAILAVKYAEVSITFRNDGQTTFSDIIDLYVGNETTPSAYKNLYIEPGESVTTKWGFVFEDTGRIKLTFKDADDNVFATKTIKSGDFTVTVKVEPEELGTVSGDGIYISGETARLTAKAKDGYELVNWTAENGEVVSTSATYSTTVYYSRTFTAHFATKEDAITVTAENKTMTYGDEVPELTYKVTGKGTMNGVPQLTTTVNERSLPGSYTINVERGSVTNWKVTFKTGKLNVNKAPMTVGVEDETIFLGDPLPTFRLTYDGFRNDDTEENSFVFLPRVDVVSETGVTGVPQAAGTYTLQVKGGYSNQYQLSSQNGVLTVLEPDAIRDVQTDNVTDNPVFDLQGRRIRAVRKGLYILNGRKVVLK